MKPFGSTHSHGDLHNLEIIEDKYGMRSKHGLPRRYTKGRFLGKGGFAKVYEVQDMETKDIFAVKIVEKASIVKPRAMAKLRSEIAIHKSLDHDKVVKFYDHFEDADFVYMILELCPNQTLNEFMRKRPNKRLSEPEAMFYIFDLIMALKYLHRRRVIHRDLKLGNLFLDADVRIKVGDFGLAALLEHDGEKRRTICGTPNYIAPEILEGKHGHSYEVDIWSLGVILYTMIIGRPPFETSDVKTTYRRIRYNQYTFPENIHLSDPAKELITCILRTEAHARLSLDEILASSWFQSSGRIPPPVPFTVSAFTITPRVGSSSTRSETPERGAADFARIDSPVPRFSLRDSSPGVVAAPAVQSGSGQHQHQLPLSQSAAPVLPSKQPPIAVPAYAPMTPGRYTPGAPLSGRPPLALRGSDENAGPVNCGSGAGATYATAKHNIIANLPTPCRPQSAHLASSISAGRISGAPQLGATGPAPGSTTSTLRGTAGPYHTSRDPSPLPGVPGSPAAHLPGKHGQVTAHTLLRSATYSAHQQGALPSARPAGSMTPKDTRSRSARDLGSSGSVGNMNLGGKTSAPMHSARGHDAPGSPQRGTQFQTPFSADAELVGHGTPCATLPLVGSVEGVKQVNSWSPAVCLDGPQRDGHDNRIGASTARIPHCASARSEGSGSGTCRLVSSSRQCPSPSPQGRTLPLETASDLWVAKWVDYSSKYGVGYILSDGSIGVYFNDSTKIILLSDGHQFDYITRRTQEKSETRSTHTFDNYPEDLKKKVTLLRHFKNYMGTDVLEKKDGATVGESSLPAPAQQPSPSHEAGQAPYVKKWTRDKHAIVFQLSNKVVQVVFLDKTEAVLSSKSHRVTYVDKKGEVCTYPLSNVLDVPSTELAKRLRYTKDILVNLLGARTTDLVPEH